MALNWNHTINSKLSACYEEELGRWEQGYAHIRTSTPGIPGVLHVTHIGNGDNCVFLPYYRDYPDPDIVWITFAPSTCNLTPELEASFREEGITNRDKMRKKMRGSQVVSYVLTREFYCCKLLIFSNGVFPERFPWDEYGALGREDHAALKESFLRRNPEVVLNDEDLVVERYEDSKRTLISLTDRNADLPVIPTDEYRVW